jgi:hypothetical protein
MTPRQTSSILRLGWLDLGEAGRRNALTFLSQFKAEDTVDELGFGILRDAIADRFFPGFNTIMTRARYFIFIPLACLRVEAEERKGEAAARRLRELEDNLCRALKDNSAGDGIIGVDAGPHLLRTPSSIYWSGLRRLDIFRRYDWDLRFYQSHLEDVYAAMGGEKDDDGLSHQPGQAIPIWDSHLEELQEDTNVSPREDGSWSPVLSFALTRAEARYLAGRFKALTEREKRESLTHHLLKEGAVFPYRYPWDGAVPAALEPLVRHARLFSMLARGGTLLYTHLLVLQRRKNPADNLECDMASLFEAWWAATKRELAAWNLEEFLDIATSLDGFSRPDDRRFIREWRTLATDASSATALLKSPAADTLIRDRERIVRPSKARLHYPEYLKRWTPPKPAELEAIRINPDLLRYRLDYRAGKAGIIIRDILQGLKGGS